MNALEVIEVGDSLGVVLPEDLLARLKLGDGDTLYLTETAHGFRLTANDPDVEVAPPLALPLLKMQKLVAKARPQNKK